MSGNGTGDYYGRSDDGYYDNTNTSRVPGVSYAEYGPPTYANYGNYGSSAGGTNQTGYTGGSWSATTSGYPQATPGDYYQPQPPVRQPTVSPQPSCLPPLRPSSYEQPHDRTRNRTPPAYPPEKSYNQPPTSSRSASYSSQPLSFDKPPVYDRNRTRTPSSFSKQGSDGRHRRSDSRTLSTSRPRHYEQRLDYGSTPSSYPQRRSDDRLPPIGSSYSEQRSDDRLPPIDLGAQQYPTAYEQTSQIPLPGETGQTQAHLQTTPLGSDTSRTQETEAFQPAYTKGHWYAKGEAVLLEEYDRNPMPSKDDFKRIRRRLPMSINPDGTMSYPREDIIENWFKKRRYRANQTSEQRERELSNQRKRMSKGKGKGKQR